MTMTHGNRTILGNGFEARRLLRDTESDNASDVHTSNVHIPIRWLCSGTFTGSVLIGQRLKGCPSMTHNGMAGNRDTCPLFCGRRDTRKSVKSSNDSVMWLMDGNVRMTFLQVDSRNSWRDLCKSVRDCKDGNFGEP
jgi:hypothetical protein